MNIEQFLTDKVAAAVSTLYGNAGAPLQIQKTRKEFEGDYTLVVFPLLKASRKSPEATATEIGEYLVANTPEIKAFNVIKGFLNLSLDSAFWAARFREVAANDTFGQAAPTGRTVMIEYSSPNTNKPLHLGHIRNNLLGYSVAQILKANGNKVIKVNLVNDRGIHICKSMLAWKLYGGGETPASSGMKATTWSVNITSNSTSTTKPRSRSSSPPGKARRRPRKTLRSCDRRRSGCAAGRPKIRKYIRCGKP